MSRLRRALRRREPAQRVRPILVVEDDADTRETVCQALKVPGYRCVSAADGLEALAYLHSAGNADLPGAIVLNLHMPNMNGWTFLKVFREDARFTRIPVIVLSGDPRADEISGIFGVLRKGSNEANALVALVRRAYEQSGSA